MSVGKQGITILLVKHLGLSLVSLLLLSRGCRFLRQCISDWSRTHYVAVLVFVAVIKHPPKPRRMYFISQLADHGGGKLRQKPKQPQWRKAAHQLAAHDSLSDLSNTTQGRLPRGGTARGRLSPPPSIINKNMSHIQAAVMG